MLGNLAAEWPRDATPDQVICVPLGHSATADRRPNLHVPRVFVGQSSWRSVMVTAGGPVRARVSARRRASGSRYRSAMRRTRSAASAQGIPAAVTNSGRSADPCTTGTAWVAVRNLDFGHPDY